MARRLARSGAAAGFLRLWTLKEAFIKATGKGLTQDLAAFWFVPFPPRIHFTPSLRGGWERLAVRAVCLDGLYRRAWDTAARPIAVQWSAIDPTRLDRDGLRC